MVDVDLFAFSKVIDVISHHMLSAKLRLLGICSPLTDWIADFLTCRVMRVSVSGICISLMDVRSNVSQRSVLGTLLLLVFVNHLPTYITSKCMFFADDPKIYFNILHSNIVKRC